MIKALVAAVTELAFQAIGATVFVYCYRLSLLPTWTSLLRVYVKVRLATEIEPGVSVNTILRLMVGLRVRTPNSLKVEVVEIDVFLEFIDEIDSDLRFSVRKGAVVSVFAFAVKAGCAKLGPVFVRVVELFDASVAVNARIT